MKNQLICGCLVAAGAAFGASERPTGEKQEFRLGSICVAGRTIGNNLQKQRKEAML